MSKRILAVDDSSQLQETLTGFLPSLDFLVAGALGSGQAFDVMQTERFDVVISAHRLADSDGFKLIEKVSSLEYSPSIVLVADDDPLERQRIREHALAYSVDLLAVLSPPIQRELLISALSDVANLSGADLESARSGVAESEFMRGLMTDGLSPVFQPKVNLRNGKVMGAEAFARWNAPGGGLLSAGAVIKVAREKGYMDVLTYRMLELALQQQGKWRREGKDVPLSINASSENLRKTDFADVVSGLAEQFGVAPSMVRLEITEADFEVDERVPLENLGRLHARGFGLGLDDFGAGFAPLMRLQSIPFDELVIDRTFLARAAENPTARVIFESAIDLAKKLKLMPTVEGVETEAQLRMAKEVGAEIAQGYLIGKPMSANEFLIWIEDYEDGVLIIPGLD